MFDKNLHTGDKVLGATERRAHPRKPLRTSARLIALGRDIAARTLDISREGMGLTSESSIPVGTECTVTFSLPTGGRGHPMRWKGRAVDVVVCGMDGFRVGLTLAPLGSSDRALLEQFLGGKGAL